MALDRIAIFSLPVSDQERSRAFYVDILGFELVRDNPMGPGQRWLEVRPGRHGSSLVLVTWFESMPPGSVRGIVVETGDVEAEHRRAVQAGLEPSEVEDAPWGRFFQLDDPDGNGLVIQETAPGV